MAHKTIYDLSGDQYDFTRSADPYLTTKIFDLLHPHSSGMHLDIGCGTGNYTMALAAKGLNFTGIDPSEKMLDVARAKAPDIPWRVGSAENIPADNDAFDNIIATLTLHHWDNLDAAFAEIHRVLKTQGKIVIYTSCPSQMQHYWLNHYFPDMLAHSIARMPSLTQVRAALNQAQLTVVHSEPYWVSRDVQDRFLYAGKERPELYFNEQYRKGISSFNALANQTEIKAGLQALKNDLETQRFDAIKRQYDASVGDYTFLVAQKQR